MSTAIDILRLTLLNRSIPGFLLTLKLVSIWVLSINLANLTRGDLLISDDLGNAFLSISDYLVLFLEILFVYHSILLFDLFLRLALLIVSIVDFLGEGAHLACYEVLSGIAKGFAKLRLPFSTTWHHS